MIMSRVPLRVSFVGGGTDIADFYQTNGGMVISTTIDKYVYVAVKRQSNIVDIKYRLNWSQIEFSQTIDEIKHPIIREAFRQLQIDFPCEVTTFSDLPGHTGLGSSSAFGVGLLHALFALKNQVKSRREIAELAADIEVNILNRPIGKQDHYAASFGGLNVLTFSPDGSTMVEPVVMQRHERDAIFRKMLLMYTGIQRDASSVLASQVEKIRTTFPMLQQMKDMVPDCRHAFQRSDVQSIGALISRNWDLKRDLGTEVTTAQIDEWLQTANLTGAFGSKLLGAGGGGFLLVLADEAKHRRIIEALPMLIPLKCAYEPFGATLVYYDN